MSTATAVSTTPLVNVDKTEQCVYVRTHYHVGIGRLKQIQVKVVSDIAESEVRNQKRLIDSPELDEIRSQDGRMQSFIDGLTAYADSGTRFLPNSQVEPLYRAMEAYRTIRRPILVAKFMVKYRELEAVDFVPLQETLKDQFNRSDYKPSDVVEAGFDFTYKLTPVGDVKNLKGIPDFIIAMEVEKEAETRRIAVAEWQSAMRVMFAGLVDKLFDAVKPTEGKRKFFDTSVTNLTDFLKSAPLRDLADDAQARAEMDKVREILAGVTPDKLRESSNLKALVASRLEEAKKTIGTLVQESGRKFR